MCVTNLTALIECLIVLLAIIEYIYIFACCDITDVNKLKAQF